METKTPTTSYHHQRAPRTPESYFNVPESIALLNIVKSERIQSAFQSNRKNHASVWEMVAEVLNRFSSRKRSAKQCCNRYENLKKIYTQLKKNPERHVRRNWPYMFLFKEIEENRGECWGSNSKRLTLIAKNHKDISYFHHRRRSIDDFNLILNKDAAQAAQHTLLQTLMQANNGTNSENSTKIKNFLTSTYAEAQLGENNLHEVLSNTNLAGLNVFNASALQLAATANALNAANESMDNKQAEQLDIAMIKNSTTATATTTATVTLSQTDEKLQPESRIDKDISTIDVAATEHKLTEKKENLNNDDKNCSQTTHMNEIENDQNISMKSEPMSDGEFNPDDIQLIQPNYNGTQGYYGNHMDHNILHPDVIVDTDNMSDCSTTNSLIMKGKGQLSTSTDGGDSTNYELIEYLKRREKRDEELLNRMDSREERLLNLLERTVVAIETLAQVNCNKQKS